MEIEDGRRPPRGVLRGVCRGSFFLKDFEIDLLTFNHPVSFQGTAIVDLAKRIAHTPATMQVLSEEYRSAGISPTLSEAAARRRGRPAGDRKHVSGRSARCSKGSSHSAVSWKPVSGNTIKYAERGQPRDWSDAQATLVSRLDRFARPKSDIRKAAVEWEVSSPLWGAMVRISSRAEPRTEKGPWRRRRWGESDRQIRSMKSGSSFAWSILPG